MINPLFFQLIELQIQYKDVKCTRAYGFRYSWMMEEDGLEKLTQCDNSLHPSLTHTHAQACSHRHLEQQIINASLRCRLF